MSGHNGDLKKAKLTWSLEQLAASLPSEEGSMYRTHSEWPDIVRT